MLRSDLKKHKTDNVRSFGSIMAHHFKKNPSMLSMKASFKANHSKKKKSKAKKSLKRL